MQQEDPSLTSDHIWGPDDGDMSEAKRRDENVLGMSCLNVLGGFYWTRTGVQTKGGRDVYNANDCGLSRFRSPPKACLHVFALHMQITRMHKKIELSPSFKVSQIVSALLQPILHRGDPGWKPISGWPQTVFATSAGYFTCGRTSHASIQPLNISINNCYLSGDYISQIGVDARLVGAGEGDDSVNTLSFNNTYGFGDGVSIVPVDNTKKRAVDDHLQRISVVGVARGRFDIYTSYAAA
ncbi:hypothetical protein EV421DRAFT_1739827 [Armillaria borealis]|uniref:Uncharacterized protein n=1 Tax=Armillaria borealis TaxID=47425 RepID=A0AA39J5S1_9AGAR|nr:hypothetical protein EV421DRAFT_1739827 [Armillaria borealis]